MSGQHSGCAKASELSGINEVERMGGSNCLAGWIIAGIATTCFMNIFDKMRSRATSTILWPCFNIPSRGQRVVCRNRDLVGSFLTFRHEAKLSMGCSFTARAFKDPTKPISDMIGYRYVGEGEAELLYDDDPDESIDDYPDWRDDEGAVARHSERSYQDSSFYAPSEDAEDDAAWS